MPKSDRLLAILRREGRFDRWVLLGEQQSRMRVVALAVPQEVANQRRALARKNHDGPALTGPDRSNGETLDLER